MEVAPSSDPVVVSRENEGMQTYHERAQRNISEREKSSYATPPGYQAVGERQQDTREHERAPQATPSGYQPVEDPDDSPKRLCGLRQVTFWLTSALVLVTVSLIAVGAGLGTYWPNYLHQVESGQPTSTITIATTATMSPTTATTTGGLLLNYTAAVPTSVSTVALDCPDQDQKTYTTGHNQTFVLSCYRGLQGADFATIVAYSYADCIEACSSYNAWTANKTGCSGIQFTNTMGATYLNDQGNCWMKNLGFRGKYGEEGGMAATLGLNSMV